MGNFIGRADLHPAPAAAPGRGRLGLTRESLGQLAVGGLGLLSFGAYIAFVVLYTNIPAGYDFPYGQNSAAVTLFDQAWRYPRYVFTAAQFQSVARALVIFLWGACVLAYLVVRRWPLSRRAVWLVGGFAVGFNLLIWLYMPPVLSRDIFYYIFSGRAWALYGANPYDASALNLTRDVTWPYLLLIWQRMPTPYGPVFVWFSTALAAVGRQSLLASFWLFKGMMMLSNIACLLVLGALARRWRPERVLPIMLLYGWNPLILLEVSGNAHNDAMMVCLALLGVWLMANERRTLAVLALMASVLVKYVSAVLLIFCLFQMAAQEKTWSKALRLTIRLSAVAACFAILVYAPFLQGFQSVERIFSAMPHLSSNQMPNGIILTVIAWGVRVLAPHYGVEYSVELVVSTYSTLMNAAFFVLLLLMIRLVLITKMDWPGVIGLSGIVSFVYIILVHGGGFPWYMISILPAALFAPALHRRGRAFLWGVLAMEIAMMLGYARLYAL
jgi:hypothetical protein